LTELRFAGAPVAAVAATTPEIAGDALRAIKVNYEVLRHVVHAPAAIRPDAPKVVAEENNLQEKGKNGDQQKAEAAFATADAVVEGEYISARVHHACLETHGMVVDYRGGDAATIYASTQGTFTIAADAAKELGLTESAVTVSVEHMGGGFGSKFGLGLEGLLACRLSKQTKSPVKLMFTRYDEFVMAGNRSGSWQKLKAGVKKDGTIVALNARQYRLGGLGPGSQAGQPYIYRMGDTYREVYALHTNEDSSVAMRAPGRTRVQDQDGPGGVSHKEPARRSLSPAVGTRCERDRLVQEKPDRGRKRWSNETRHGLRCRHVGRRRKQPV
jgi:xanthine dehydrogenase YagR molybdenum-binding subunit